MGINRPRRQFRPRKYEAPYDLPEICPHDRGPGLSTSLKTGLEIGEAEWLQRDPDMEGVRFFRGLLYGLGVTLLGVLAILALALALANFSDVAPVSCAAKACPVAP